MAQRDDWTRNDRWDEAERRSFFERLSRSRSVYTRLWHLQMKSHYLKQTGDPAKLDAAVELQVQSCREAEQEAGRLPEREAEHYRRWAFNAQAHAGDVRLDQRRFSEAIEYYREAIRRQKGPPEAFIVRMARAVYEARRVKDYREMLDLLHASFEAHGESYAIYRRTIFEYAFYQAVLSFELGLMDAARCYARAAVAVAAKPDHGVGQRLSLGTAHTTANELATIRKILDVAVGT